MIAHAGRDSRTAYAVANDYVLGERGPEIVSPPINSAGVITKTANWVPIASEGLRYAETVRNWMDRALVHAWNAYDWNLETPKTARKT